MSRLTLLLTDSNVFIGFTMPGQVSFFADLNSMRRAERERHQERARLLKAKLARVGLPVMENPSHIVPLLVGDPVLTKRITDALLSRFDIYVQPINYPTVPRGTERLRITPQPQHSDRDMDWLVAALGKLWQELGLPLQQRVQAAE